MTALKLILKIVIAPVILLLTLAIWICVGLVYVSGLVLGLLSTVIAAEAGLLAAGQSPGFEICNSGFGLRLKRHPLPLAERVFSL